MPPDSRQSQATSPAVPAPTKLFVTVLALVTFVGPLSLHMFFPAIPAIKADFGVSEAVAQLTASLPLFAMAVLTLVYGSLSDRHGRRRALLGGLALFFVGGAISAVSTSIWMLIAGRLVQAAGGACGLALARAIARDVYGTDRLVRVIAYLTMAYALGPMIAVPIGGFLTDLAGWRSVVGFAAGVGLLIAVLAYVTIYETNTDRDASAVRRSYLSDYVRLFKDLRFCAFVIQSGASSGAFFATATGTAFLMTGYLGRPASEYGLYFLFFPFGYLSGNFVASRLGGRVAIETMVLASSLILVVTIAVQAAFVLPGIVTPLTVMGPGFMITFAQGIGLANAQVGAMRIAGNLAGTAAGIGVFLQMFSAGAFSQLYGMVADGTPTPLIVVVASAALLGMVAGVIPFVMVRRPKA